MRSEALTRSPAPPPAAHCTIRGAETNEAAQLVKRKAKRRQPEPQPQPQPQLDDGAQHQPVASPLERTCLTSDFVLAAAAAATTATTTATTTTTAAAATAETEATSAEAAATSSGLPGD
ncbi:hypothetical protein AWZ03_000852 [Drosophila navojoa]|uniref:Uncharacterized protein n=1 Tax=Drosophila navojoa TaxID=7232 RepID=A0A484BUX8_DRONA|nr:hypothetical protein AWZ03_000852 [Drosophila navojoa]